MRELIPSARVRCGAHPHSLDVADDTSLLELNIPGTHGGTPLRDWLNATHVDSIVVLQRRNLILEWQASDVSPDEPHLLFSVTKSVTSLLVGTLVGDRLIDVDALVTDYVPEVASSGFAGATVRNLLDMTAAFAFVENYDPGDDLRAYRDAAGWYPTAPDSEGLRDFLVTRQPDGMHGERFRYQSPATDLLGWVIEAVTSQPFATVLSERVWVPMGAEADADLALDRFGIPRNAGGLSAIPRDMARLGLIVAEGGAGVVHADYIDDLTRNGSTEQWRVGDFAPWLPGGAYRSCWYQPRVDPDAVMGVGIHGQMLYVDRAREVVVAKQSSWPVPDNTDLHNDAYLACQAIARALG